jgi:hypothetical protein
MALIYFTLTGKYIKYWFNNYLSNLSRGHFKQVLGWPLLFFERLVFTERLFFLPLQFVF